MRCHPSTNTITDRQADKRIEDWIPGLNTSYSCSSEVLTYCAVLLTVDNNPPWQVGVAFHTVRESEAPDQTRFCAPMDPQEGSVMSWNNIILAILCWAIRFSLAHTRKNSFLVWERSIENIQGGMYSGKAAIITATFSSDSTQDILTGACGVWNPRPVYNHPKYSVDTAVRRMRMDAWTKYQHRKTSEIMKIMNRCPKKQIKPSMIMSSTGWELCVCVCIFWYWWIRVTVCRT